MNTNNLSRTVIAVCAFAAGIAVSFFTLPLWVAILQLAPREGSRSDWLGFAGGLMGNTLTGMIAGLAIFYGWKGIERQMRIGIIGREEERMEKVLPGVRETIGYLQDLQMKLRTGNPHSVNSNVVATQYGIRFSLVQDGLTISNNAIEMQTSGALAAIYGVAQPNVPNTVTNIIGNTFLSNGTTTVTNGVQINDADSSRQDNVTIENNKFSRLQGYDIAFYNPGGRNRIVGNVCSSTGTIGSILVGDIQTGTTIVEGNFCANTITYATPTNLTGGSIRRADNTVMGGTPETASWQVTTNSTTAGRVMIGAGAGSQPTPGPLGTATQVWHGNNTYSAVVSADMNITATNCTNQFVSAISTGGVGTCSSTGATAAVDTSNTNVATNAFVINQAAAATPLAPSGAGAVGTSTRFARADHVHPASSTNTNLSFAADDAQALVAASTFYIGAGRVAASENVAAFPLSAPGTIKNLYCSTNSGPGGATTYIATLRKNASSQTLTCTMTGAATTCNDTPHTFTGAAGDLLSLQLVTLTGAATANGFNCSVSLVTTSP